MRKKAFYLALVGLLALLFSCELMVDADVPVTPPKIVVNAFLSPDCVMTVSVTQSRFILDTLYFYSPITTAIVRISDESGNEALLNHVTDDLYKSGTKPMAGQLYTIHVGAEDFEPVTSSIRIPDLISILEVTVDSTEIKAGLYPSHTPVTLTFLDPPENKNYYQARIEQRVAYEFTDYSTQEIRYDTFRRVYSIIPKSGVEEETTLISDLLFNGELHTIRAEVEQFYDYNTKQTVLENKVVLLSYSLEYYNYITTMRLQMNTEGDPFAQPVLVYNNIQNGFGIFAGYSQSAKDIRD